MVVQQTVGHFNYPGVVAAALSAIPESSYISKKTSVIDIGISANDSTVGYGTF